MQNSALGQSGKTVVIEEFLVGKEISVHALCNGEDVLLFPPSQDHKRAYDHDEGPNTGGMGTIAPVPDVTDAVMARIRDDVVLPTLRALARRGTPFQGLLFPGIMLTADGPKVIEFNARFGDPETQTYMRLFESDLAHVLLQAAHGNLADTHIAWRAGAAATVMAAAGGYPESYERGAPITGLRDAESDPAVVVFHSGTARVGQDFITNGGRVLGVSAIGDELSDAIKKAYTALAKVSFKDMHYRTDIGLLSERN